MPTPNCRPGDLAIIHGLKHALQDNGLIVTAVEVVRINDTGTWWAVEPATFNPAGKPYLYNDRNLKPIRGTDTPTAVKETLDACDKQTA